MKYQALRPQFFSVGGWGVVGVGRGGGCRVDGGGGGVGGGVGRGGAGRVGGGGVVGRVGVVGWVVVRWGW